MNSSMSWFRAVPVFALTSALLAGCAANEGTVAPPMPIPMATAQGYAQQRQQGVNITRQFVGRWEAAKHHMQDSFENCLAVSNANGGGTTACWQQMDHQATGYANQFSGLYADGLQGAQQQHFAMARQSAVTYFQLLESYAKQCIRNVDACMSSGDATKMAITNAKKRVDDLLAGTVTDGSVGAQYESGQVNSNLSGLSSSPSAVAPTAQTPALQER